jgi:hypothetical protein
VSDILDNDIFILKAWNIASIPKRPLLSPRYHRIDSKYLDVHNAKMLLEEHGDHTCFSSGLFELHCRRSPFSVTTLHLVLVLLLGTLNDLTKLHQKQDSWTFVYHAAALEKNYTDAFSTLFTENLDRCIELWRSSVDIRRYLHQSTYLPWPFYSFTDYITLGRLQWFLGRGAT